MITLRLYILYLRDLHVLHHRIGCPLLHYVTASISPEGEELVNVHDEYITDAGLGSGKRKEQFVLVLFPFVLVLLTSLKLLVGLRLTVMVQGQGRSTSSDGREKTGRRRQTFVLYTFSESPSEVCLSYPRTVGVGGMYRHHHHRRVFWVFQPAPVAGA